MCGLHQWMGRAEDQGKCLKSSGELPESGSFLFLTTMSVGVTSMGHVNSVTHMLALLDNLADM